MITQSWSWVVALVIRFTSLITAALRVMGNLEKLDALKELLNDWSILGKDDNGNYFPDLFNV